MDSEIINVSREPWGWLCDQFGLSVSPSVCLCVINFCKQYFSKAKLQIFAQNSLRSFLENINFSADHNQDVWE